MTFEAVIILVLRGAKPERRLAFEKLAAAGSRHMTDRHRYAVGDVNIVLRREQMSENQLLERRKIGALLDKRLIAAKPGKPVLPMRFGVTPYSRVVMMPLHLAENLYRQNLGFRQLRSSSAQYQFPAVQHDANFGHEKSKPDMITSVRPPQAPAAKGVLLTAETK